MKRKKRLRMVVKISILVSLSILISSLVSAYVLLYRQEKLYQNERRGQMLSVAKFYSVLVKNEMWTGKTKRIIQALENLNAIEGVAFFRVEDDSGKIIYYSENFGNMFYCTGRKFKFVGKRKGELKFRINDSSINDNKGFLTVKVRGVELRVAADKQWQGSGVFLNPGDVVVITASGTWMNRNVAYVPDGMNRTSRDYWVVFPDRHNFSLIERVDDGTNRDNMIEIAPEMSDAKIGEVYTDMTVHGKYLGRLTVGYFIETSLEAEREKRITLMAKSMAPNVRSLLENMEFVELSYYVKQTAEELKEFSYGIIIDPENNVVFHTDKKYEGQALTDKASLSAYSAIMTGIDPYIQSTNDLNTGLPILDIAVPVESGGKLIGIIRLAYQKGPLDRAIRREKLSLLALVFLCMLTGITVSVVIARRIAKPILKLARAAHLIGKGDLDVEIGIRTGGEEIVRLSESFKSMVKGLKERDVIKETFSRYVTREVAEEVLKNPGQIAPGGKKQLVTILFSDIRGFTAFSENKSPEEVVSRLNEYLSAMVDVIFENDGTLDKFIGDAVMAVFGSPIQREDDPMRAVRTALEMQKRLAALNSKWRAEGKEELRVGIGVNTGEVIAGNIGDIRRMEYTVIGDNVNVASRLVNLTKDYNCPIIISESTYFLVKKIVDVRPLGLVTVKGKSQAVEIYELLDAHGEFDRNQ